MIHIILAINPGSTSTKVAIFENAKKVKQKNLSHSKEEVLKFDKITDQFEFRKTAILNWLEEEGIPLKSLKAVVGRGGLLRPMPAGTYYVSNFMVEDLKIGIQGEHASNLGGIIAKAIGDSVNIPAFIVDPVAVDEFIDIARISGLPEIPRRSLVHALNIRAIAIEMADGIGKDIEDLNLILAHLGGGISVVPMEKGRIIDANNANEDGPFSPERTGGLPGIPLVDMAFSGKYTYKELKRKLVGMGGLSGYLGTNDAREVEKMIDEGNQEAKRVFDAMAYQIGKEIGACATALCGNVDKIILTGGLAYSRQLVEYIIDMVKFIAPVEVIPGEDEMQSLGEGAYRVITGRDKVKIYEKEVKI